MNIDNTSTVKKNSRFILSRRHQKGQVAIFVALIFQVIFVFFALLINVGLLVHHKINLQHSADLAAYYGAMKQAEGLNAIAHVNFQIKQAWKLLTWRYRVLGTFGFTNGNNGQSQIFPYEYRSGGFLWNALNANSNLSTNGNDNFRCASLQLPNGTQLGVQDIPFFCIGHAGFSSWPSGESNCRLSCSDFSQASLIATLPNATNNNIPFGGNVAAGINAAINQVNINLADKCNRIHVKRVTSTLDNFVTFQRRNVLVADYHT